MAILNKKVRKMAGKDFGFATKAGRQIDLDQLDTTLADKIALAVNSWRACISCGSCTATCPAGVKFHLQLPTLNRAFQLGTDFFLELPTLNRAFQLGTASCLELATLKSCLLCGKCQLVCPRGIPTRYVSIQIMQKFKSNSHVAKGIPSV
jgi:heterodisulfide reductase subunit C